MIKVTLGNNLKRATVIIPETTVLRDALESNDIDYSRATMHLDGRPLAAGEIDQTFSALGVVDRCFLLGVVKADNA